MLKSIASAIVNELKKINQNVAALPVASSVMDRLSYILPSARPELGVGPGRSVDRYNFIAYKGIGHPSWIDEFLN